MGSGMETPLAGLCEAVLEHAGNQACERKLGQDCELWVQRDFCGGPHLWALATLEGRIFSVVTRAGWA